MARTAAVAFSVIATLAGSAEAATIRINNVDEPGVGFNDTTPAAPVGGNNGMTLGEQRRILFEFAAGLWGASLHSRVDIVVQATFQPLPCSPTSGVLGAAGPIQVFAFGAPPPRAKADTWYAVALANSLAREDLAPGPFDPGLLVEPFADDIVAFFNGAIGTDPGCLTGLGWYYGLDNNAPANQLDLLNVVMHEFAHGLGFLELVDAATGQLFFGLPDIYSTFMRDNTLGKRWHQMTDAERLFSQVNTLNLVWDGPVTRLAALLLLDPRASVGITRPNSIKGSYEGQPATFGPEVTSSGTPGDVVLVNDEVGAVADACQPIKNDVNGRIALIDRGTCFFNVKVKNAQDAGAVGAIVANNVAKGLPSMAGVDPMIVIPSVGVTQADGAILKAELAAGRTVKGRLFLDHKFRQGADSKFRPRLYAPDPVQDGSSKSHWDTTLKPNLLMEPFINADLKAGENLDLTTFLFLDIGWIALPLLPF